MSERIEYIGRRDVAWSYLSTFFSVGAGLILWPFILSQMPAETVGVWNIFQTLTGLVLLLDFGFRPSFARTLSYVFSGVQSLQRDGVEQTGGGAVNDALLSNLIAAMRCFYRWIALAVWALLATAGTAYFYFVMQKYGGDHRDAAIAWVLFVLINCYNLYTFYYEALLLGKGLVKRSQQINILGQTTYILLAIAFIYAGFGLTAIVAAQLVSTVVRRVLSHRVFYTPELRAHLLPADRAESQKIFRTLLPNAAKVGLTTVGDFFVSRSAIFIGLAFLPLEQIAALGITIQAIDILNRCAQVYYCAFTPKIAQCRAEHDLQLLRSFYKKSIGFMLAVFMLGGTVWLLFGEWALSLIGSSTHFVPSLMILAVLVFGILEQNHTIAQGFIMADNRIPFFIPSLLTAAATILLTWLLAGPCGMGLWGLILAPGIAQIAYQYWRWPLMIIQELRKADN